MELKTILEKIEQIKKFLSKDNVFKSEISTNQKIEIAIFEMMKQKKYITKESIKQHTKGVGKLYNHNNYKDMFNLWKEEIDNHKGEFFRNQTSFF